MKEKNVFKSKKGITLIALTVTIVVLIILAGISISVLGGEDGLIEQAKKAKEETEISEEKELLGRATVQVAGKDVYGNIEEEALQKELDKEAGEGKTEVTDIGEEFEVIFKEKDRYYIVDKDGNIGNAQEIIDDKNPGDITKDKDGNELDGSEEKPYEIWCIEDLVEWSLNYVKYQNSNIILCRDLNFKSKLSYNNSERTDYGDLNGNTEDENILINEMTTGNGFKPITMFMGKFNGQDNEIKNIYENVDGKGGLIGFTENATIINLKITGSITSISDYVGGIICYDNGGTTISDCGSKVDIIAKDRSNIGDGTGGIIGTLSETGIVNNCYNHGKVIGNSMVGGIIGGLCGEVKNSYNSGIITSNETETYTGTGGIVGGSINATNAQIINCYNLEQGVVNGTKTSGGIIGRISSTSKEKIKIMNSFNLGQINGEINGGIIGTIYSSSVDSYTYVETINSYNFGKISLGKYIGGIVGQIWQINGTLEKNIKNCFNGGEISTLATNYGEIIGRNINATTELNNCYYSNSRINKTIGSGNIIGIAEQINIGSNLIEKLNIYVDEYNEQNLNNDDFIELRKWIIDEKTQKIKFK